MAVAVSHRRFRVDEYDALRRAGVLTEEERTELIDGEILEMAPIGNPHAATVDHVNMALKVGGVVVRVQSHVQLGEWSKPQPDLALLKPPVDQYWYRSPMPADVLLLVEVSDTTYAYDTKVKVPLYARAGIPEVWIVEPLRRRLTVYRDPRAGEYATVFAPAEHDPLAVPGTGTVMVAGTLLLTPPPDEMPG